MPSSRNRRQRTLSPEEMIRAIKLLELQRHAMLMYTSCGWFFDDISGLETVQVIQFAGRALQLAKEVFGDGLEYRFMQLLGKAPSNIRDHKDGRRIYEKFVKPAMVNLATVGAHYAMRSLFEEYPQQASVNCYTIAQSFFRSLAVGRAKLAMGRVRITSTLTRESACLCFGAIHWGDHNISCCISPCLEAAAPEEAFVNEVFRSLQPGRVSDLTSAAGEKDRHLDLFAAPPVPGRATADLADRAGGQPVQCRGRLPPDLRYQWTPAALSKRPQRSGTPRPGRRRRIPAQRRHPPGLRKPRLRPEPPSGSCWTPPPCTA